MRITLSIANDVLAAAKAIGRESGATLGEMISELARKTRQQSLAKGIRNGVPILPAGKRDKPVTLKTKRLPQSPAAKPRCIGSTPSDATAYAAAAASALMRWIIALTPFERWGVRCASNPNSRKIASASTAAISAGVRFEYIAIAMATRPRTRCESLSPR